MRLILALALLTGCATTKCRDLDSIVGRCNDLRNCISRSQHSRHKSDLMAHCKAVNLGITRKSCRKVYKKAVSCE